MLLYKTAALRPYKLYGFRHLHKKKKINNTILWLTVWRRSCLGGPIVLRAEYKCISVSASRYGKCSDVNIRGRLVSILIFFPHRYLIGIFHCIESRISYCYHNVILIAGVFRRLPLRFTCRTHILLCISILKKKKKTEWGKKLLW